MHKDEKCTTLALRCQKSLQTPKMNNVLCFFIYIRKVFVNPWAKLAKYISISQGYIKIFIMRQRWITGVNVMSTSNVRIWRFLDVMLGYKRIWYLAYFFIKCWVWVISCTYSRCICNYSCWGKYGSLFWTKLGIFNIDNDVNCNFVVLNIFTRRKY